ncbi:MAG: RHS repeat-associated core domain-containing protein, partial [Dysgonomonas sp.]
KLGLNLYDYSARQMDNAVPRFTSIDPHAEKYPSISPYAYCNNNPLRYIDPDGKDWIEKLKSYINEHYYFETGLTFQNIVRDKGSGMRFAANVKGMGIDIGKSQQHMGIEISADKNGVEVDTHGQGNTDKFTSIGKLGVPIPWAVGDAAGIVGVEAGIKKETIVNKQNNKDQATITEGTIAVTPIAKLPLAIEGSRVVTTETGSNISTIQNRVGISTGFTLIIGAGFDIYLNFGLQEKYKKTK